MDSEREVDPALLSRIAASIKQDLRPVQPMPPAWLLTTLLAAACATIALLGAAKSGFTGFEKMGVLDRVLIFPLLALLIPATAAACVSEMIPGSRRFISPVYLLPALLAVFVFVFRDYHAVNFLSQGLVCLGTGLLYAAPTAIAAWFLLRRGFAVNPKMAGATAGVLSGLAGLTMLELDCPNPELLHVITWHVAVLVVSGAIGFWLGARADHRR
jgi:hypothetical protein